MRSPDLKLDPCRAAFVAGSLSEACSNGSFSEGKPYSMWSKLGKRKASSQVVAPQQEVAERGGHVETQKKREKRDGSGFARAIMCERRHVENGAASTRAHHKKPVNKGRCAIRCDGRAHQERLTDREFR